MPDRAAKIYFLQALDLVGVLRRPAACEFLGAWPMLEAVQRASGSELHRFHHDHRRLSTEDLKKPFYRVDRVQPLSRDPALVEGSPLMA